MVPRRQDAAAIRDDDLERPPAKVGDSRDRLTEAHLAIFRERYADQIHSLGYEVR